MKRLSKVVVTCALAVTMISPARSAVGFSFAAPIAVVAGVAAMASAGTAAYGGYRLFKRGNTLAAVGVWTLAAGASYFGFLLLDGGQGAQFAELSEKSAAELGVSETERSIYNSEIEQVNAIAREIGSELVRQNSDSAELARDMWMELGYHLSPETMKTVITIAQQK